MSILVISDMDGTLIPDRGELSLNSQHLLTLFIEKGNLFSVATSRAPKATLPKLNNLSLSIPLVTLNGACLVDPKDNSVHQLNEMFQAHTLFKSYNWLLNTTSPFFITACKDNKIIWYNQGVDLSYFQYFFGQDVDSFDLFPITNLIPDYNTNILSFYFLIDPKNTLLVDKCRETFLSEFDVYTFPEKKQGYKWLCLHSFLATKKHAICQIAEKYDIQNKNVHVFGNEMNDMSMIQYFENSYAVENANPIIIKTAKNIIGPCEEDSVAKHILRLKR